MLIGIIGRNEILYNTMLALLESGNQIAFVLTAKEAPEYKKKASDFESFAKKNSIPFANTPRINEFYKLISSCKADLAVSVNYSGIIPQSVIDVFPHGILNAHGGDLPRYRGNACQAWAIINGENKVALCIHKMIGDELDSGPIIEREYMEIDESTKITEVYQWLEDITPGLFLRAIEKLKFNKSFVLEYQSVNPKNSLRCYPRRPEDGRINWEKSSLEILRIINASNKPYSGAFCYLGDKKVIIWDADMDREYENCLGVPGQVTKVGIDNVNILCGTGKIILRKIEIDGVTEAPSFFIKSIRTRLS
jgi:UDP-4-amino-4-deoxy-L-arabinose formyltransferase/UDP-glucuronic acid dehydrogenase (UDP-4-keto-hexauronic acid decarboxylating)